MAKPGPKGYTPEQCISLLRQIEADMGADDSLDLERACAQAGISTQSYYRWRKQYGSMTQDDAKRLRELEKENSRLKKLVADLSLDKDILQEALRGKP